MSEKPDVPKLKIITISIPETMVVWGDGVVQEGYFESRSEAFRFCIAYTIQEMAKKKSQDRRERLATPREKDGGMT